MKGAPAWNAEGLRRGLWALYASGKVVVRKREDGQLEVRRAGVDPAVVGVLDPVSRRWTLGAETGVGFVALARRLGLELQDGLAPWLADVIE